MASLGFTKEELQGMRISSDSSLQLEERTFNLIFGGTLLWGLILNLILVKFLTVPMANLLYAGGKNSGTIMLVIILAYVALCFLGNHLLRSESTAVNFLGFNLIAAPVGVVLSIAMVAYIGEPDLVRNAFLLTATITLMMIVLSMLFPAFFNGIGHLLGISLLCVLIISLVSSLFFHTSLTVIDYIVAGIMSLYIGYDWGRVSQCSRTARNAICIASSLYLDIVNLFLRILSILSKSKRNK